MNTEPIVESEGTAGKVVVCRCGRWLKRIGWGIVVLAVLYRPEEKGFVLYSIGANGKDDGGKVSKFSDEGDIVWRM